jgi:serine phosphatase RsbU (regulator of sigma subunit)
VKVVGTAVAGTGQDSVPVARGTLDRAEAAVSGGTRRRPALHGATAAVLATGLLLTAALALAARAVHASNEDRLLDQRTNEAATVLTASIPGTQAPLASAGVLAQETGGERAALEKLFAPIVAEKRPFAAVALYRANALDGEPIAVTGEPIEFAARPASERAAFLQRAVRSAQLSVFDLLAAPNRRIGWALASPAPQDYVVYAESAVPKDRTANIAGNSAFADFDYAFYLGTERDQAHLVASSRPGGRMQGRDAEVAVPFGDSQLLLVMSPKDDLGGTVLLRLPWILALSGLVLTAAATALVERLVRRREHAERLADELELVADENARLYAAQRSVAETLQQSLLPEALPRVDGIESAVRYVAGTEGIEIGGDWYDVVPLGDGCMIVVIGDVSGRGLRAATIMASLRYAVRAYTADEHDPAELLAKVSRLLSVRHDEHFATLLCALVDVGSRTITIANAGHPDPLLVHAGGAEFVRTESGLPIGVTNPSTYTSTTVTVPPGGTLLAYTDGLVERRGESLDVGLDRLRAAAVGVNGASVERLLDHVVAELTPDGSDDDTAVLALRWNA